MRKGTTRVYAHRHESTSTESVDVFPAAYRRDLRKTRVIFTGHYYLGSVASLRVNRRQLPTEIVPGETVHVYNAETNLRYYRTLKWKEKIIENTEDIIV